MFIITLTGPAPPSRLDMASCVIRWAWNHAASTEEEVIADSMKTNLTLSEEASSTANISGNLPTYHALNVYVHV